MPIPPTDPARPAVPEAPEAPESPGSPAAPPDAPGERPAFLIPLRPLGWGAPLRWLALGWRDFTRCPGIGLFYGACFMAMGWLLMTAFEHAPAYVLALSAGFLLVGPFLCLGLYQASRHLAGASNPTWATR